MKAARAKAPPTRDELNEWIKRDEQRMKEKAAKDVNDP